MTPKRCLAFDKCRDRRAQRKSPMGARHIGLSIFLERVKGKKPYTKFIQQKQQLTKLCAQKMGKKVWVECVGGLYARSDEVVYQTSAYWH